MKKRPRSSHFKKHLGLKLLFGGGFLTDLFVPTWLFTPASVYNFFNDYNCF